MQSGLAVNSDTVKYPPPNIASTRRGFAAHSDGATRIEVSVLAKALVTHPPRGLRLPLACRVTNQNWSLSVVLISMELLWDNRKLLFEPVNLYFEDGLVENVFAGKNNKTVEDTLTHRRYVKLGEEIIKKYPHYLTWKLGEFILYLKSNDDKLYLKFLNKYGDGVYSRFLIKEEKYLDKKGVYIYTVSDQLHYIGRCRDSFRKRINQGYGKIHPKNCYIDGQATNCRLNALITERRQEVRFFVHVMESNTEIEAIEKSLIALYNPCWNIALKSTQILEGS